jgi:hypothetical protein
MVFADLALARRLEAADAQGYVEYVEALRQLRPDSDAAVVPVGGGLAAFAGVTSPLSRTIGLGLGDPVLACELDLVESFYRYRGAVSRVEVCPLAHSSLVELLGARGYRIAQFKNVWVRAPGRERSPAAASGIRVGEASPAEAELWVGTVSQGFAGRDEIQLEDMEVATPNFHRASTRCFLAWVDDAPAGGGCMSVHEGLAMLFSTSTRPAFRGRGVQAALLGVRLAAAAAGCDLVTVSTVPGSASQRNVERMDFALAYTKVVLERELS